MRWLSDPIFGETGDYSQETKSIFGNLTRLDNFSHWKLPEFTTEEKKTNLKTADFFGLNFYNGNLFIGFDKTGIIRAAIDAYLEINGQERIPKSDTYCLVIYLNRMKDQHKNRFNPNKDPVDYIMYCKDMWIGASEWLHHTPVLYRHMIRTIHRWYGVPIIGTENGVSGGDDWVDENLNDWWRKRQIQEYIGQGRDKTKIGIGQQPPKILTFFLNSTDKIYPVIRQPGLLRKTVSSILVILSGV